MKSNKTALVIIAIMIAGAAVNYYFSDRVQSEKVVEHNWKIFYDAELGIAFQYPETLTTKYIDAIDWPPTAQVLDDPFNCFEAGEESARAGRTEPRMINGRPFCVTKVTEGAAGSVYTQYAYAFPIASQNGSSEHDKEAILTLSLRFVQCNNFDEPSRTECKNERSAFNIDGLIDRIAETFAFVM